MRFPKLYNPASVKVWLVTWFLALGIFVLDVSWGSAVLLFVITAGLFRAKYLQDHKEV